MVREVDKVEASHTNYDHCSHADFPSNIMNCNITKVVNQVEEQKSRATN